MRICLLFLMLVGNQAWSAEFVAKVIAVLDGDTVLVKRANGLVKIRLAGIDAPEKAQTFGETSKRSLSDMVLGKQVKINSQAKDQYGRMVATLEVGGMDVNLEQLRRGMAWENSHFHADKKLLALQEEAKQAPRGLWAQSNPVPPWKWRKQHPSVIPAISPTASTDAAPANTVHAPFMPSGCGAKKHCLEMSSCEEAKYYLTACGITTIDGDGDGVPCEKLCAPTKSKTD